MQHPTESNLTDYAELAKRLIDEDLERRFAAEPEMSPNRKRFLKLVSKDEDIRLMCLMADAVIKERKKDSEVTVQEYKCKHCGKTVKRSSTKKWINSFCDVAGRAVRITLVKPKTTDYGNTDK